MVVQAALSGDLSPGLCWARCGLDPRKGRGSHSTLTRIQVDKPVRSLAAVALGGGGEVGNGDDVVSSAMTRAGARQPRCVGAVEQDHRSLCKLGTARGGAMSRRVSSWVNAAEGRGDVYAWEKMLCAGKR